MTLTHNLTKQWQCNNYFNVTITIVLVTSQKRRRVVSEIAGVFSGRAILEIIAREGHTKHVIALCFQPIKTLDFTQTCNKIIFIVFNTTSLTLPLVTDSGRGKVSSSSCGLSGLSGGRLVSSCTACTGCRGCTACTGGVQERERGLMGGRRSASSCRETSTFLAPPVLRTTSILFFTATLRFSSELSSLSREYTAKPLYIFGQLWKFSLLCAFKYLCTAL